MLLQRVRIHLSKEEFQATLDEDAEFTDSIIYKLSQLKILKEVEKRHRLTNLRQNMRLEKSLQQIQEQIRHLQSTSRGMEMGISRIWSQLLTEAIQPPKFDIAPFKGEVLKWQEFWDAFVASVDKADYTPVDKFNYLKSKIRGETFRSYCSITPIK